MPKAGERAAQRKRVQRVLTLHANGLSVRDIAAEEGISVAVATRRLAEGMDALPSQEVDHLRLTSELRLDRLARVFSELLDDPDSTTRLRAAQGLAGVERDRARLLGTWQKPPKDDDADRLPSR